MAEKPSSIRRQLGSARARCANTALRLLLPLLLVLLAGTPATADTVQAVAADFTLDTTGIDPRSLDIGLRVYDGTAIIRIGAQPGAPTSPLRIHKNGTTYGIQLVDPNSPDASKIRIQTPSGTKALQKLP